jgi:hypothetical protein
MRVVIAFSCLVVAFVTAGATRLRTEPRSTKNVAAPTRVKPLQVERAPSAHEASAAQPPLPSLPWLDVGPDEEAPAPIKKEPPIPALTVAAAPPAPRDLAREMSERQQERFRRFLTRMMKYEMPALNRCYLDAQQRHRYLRRDVRLSLTVTHQPDGESKLESAELDVDGYRPPAFERCMQHALTKLVLPYVDERVTVTLPISLNPDEAEEVENEPDSDDEEDDA